MKVLPGRAFPYATTAAKSQQFNGKTITTQLHITLLKTEDMIGSNSIRSNNTTILIVTYGYHRPRTFGSGCLDVDQFQLLFSQFNLFKYPIISYFIFLLDYTKNITIFISMTSKRRVQTWHFRRSTRAYYKIRD